MSRREVRARVGALGVLLSFSLAGTAIRAETGGAGDVADVADVAAIEPLRISGEVTIAPLVLLNPSFGAPLEIDDIGEASTGGGTDRVWAEAWTRILVERDLGDRATLSLRGAAVGTLDEDPFGIENDGEGLLETAQVELRDVGVDGLAFVLGRQNFRVGDGFFLDDGHVDDRAAAWSAPLRFWDGTRADLHHGRFAASAFGFRLARDFDETDGTLFGAHATWSPDEEATAEAHSVTADEDLPARYAGAGIVVRADDTEDDLDARLVSVRAATPAGPVLVSGEFGHEFGSRGETDLGGTAFHIDAGAALPFGADSYVLLSRLHFSGDDPSTDTDETFSPWNFGARDWSLYYLGELVGSSLLVNSDLRVIKIESGCRPNASSWLRAYWLRLDADEGGSLELPPETGKRFADELDVAFDWAPEEAPWSAWALTAVAWPKGAAIAAFGSRTSILLSFGLKRTF